MGDYLKRIDDDAAKELSRLEKDLADLTKSNEWQATKSAADIAGIIDPTPTSDAISFGMSVAEGDWVGAFLSGVSFIPYLGDAVAKPVKIARATKAIVAIERRAAAIAKQINHLKSVAYKTAQRKMAAAAERARRAKEAGERYAKAMKCKKCPKPANRFGTPLPSTGKWKGEKGNSRWTSDDGSVSLDYKEGYPDFSTSKPKSVAGEVEIDMRGKGSDFTAARNQMREKRENPKWPGNGKNAPDGYTWHHKEDGTTMQLVRTDVHDKRISRGGSGASHGGGESIVSGKDNWKQDSQF